MIVRTLVNGTAAPNNVPTFQNGTLGNLVYVLRHGEKWLYKFGADFQVWGKSKEHAYEFPTHKDCEEIKKRFAKRARIEPSLRPQINETQINETPIKAEEILESRIESDEFDFAQYNEAVDAQFDSRLESTDKVERKWNSAVPASMVNFMIFQPLSEGEMDMGEIPEDFN